MDEWLIAGFCTGSGLIVAWAQVKKPVWLRRLFLSAGLVLAVGSPLAAGFIHWERLRAQWAAAKSAVPYPAALLDCYEDARAFRSHTFFQRNLPDNVIYATETGGFEISPTDSQGSYRDADGNIYQLAGPFIQCSLINEGNQDLSDLKVRFDFLYAPAVSEAAVAANSFMPLVIYGAELPPTVTITASRSYLKHGDHFDFAIANFGSHYGFLDFGHGLSRGPTLSYRLGSTGLSSSNQAIILTCRAKGAMAVPIPPSQKANHLLRFMEQCVRAVTTGAEALGRALIPPICKKHHQYTVQMFGEATNCSGDLGD
jgi:hypothetical protein